MNDEQIYNLRPEAVAASAASMCRHRALYLQQIKGLKGGARRWYAKRAEEYTKQIVDAANFLIEYRH